MQCRSGARGRGGVGGNAHGGRVLWQGPHPPKRHPLHDTLATRESRLRNAHAKRRFYAIHHNGVTAPTTTAQSCNRVSCDTLSALASTPDSRLPHPSSRRKVRYWDTAIATAAAARKAAVIAGAALSLLPDALLPPGAVVDPVPGNVAPAGGEPPVVATQHVPVCGERQTPPLHCPSEDAWPHW